MAAGDWHLSEGPSFRGLAAGNPGLLSQRRRRLPVRANARGTEALHYGFIRVWGADAKHLPFTPLPNGVSKRHEYKAKR